MPYSVSPYLNLEQFPPADIKTKVEFFALHAAEFGDDEMSQLVNENHESQGNGDNLKSII